MKIAVSEKTSICIHMLKNKKRSLLHLSMCVCVCVRVHLPFV